MKVSERTFVSQALENATVYRDIVESTCKVLGGARGHLYLTLPGGHRQWMAYDRDGKQVKERSSMTAGRVIESGTLINNTKQPDQSPRSDEGAAAQNARSSPDDDAFKEGKIMCAPITTIDAYHKAGTVVSLSISGGGVYRYILYRYIV